MTIAQESVAAVAKQTLQIKGVKKAELSILFASKQHIHHLNQRFRHVDQPTDVLAFSVLEGRPLPGAPEVLGDVVICPEITRRFAKIYHTTKEKELYLCLVHGILHLLGYDDTTAKGRALMEKEQTDIIQQIKTSKRK